MRSDVAPNQICRGTACRAAATVAGPEPVADWPEMAGISPDYETNPIARQARHSADFPPNFHRLALPPVGKTGPGADFHR